MSPGARHQSSADRRASHADREIVLELLRTAVADGRLDLHELDDRVAHACRSRTFGELGALVADLGVELTPPEPVTVTGGSTGETGLDVAPASTACSGPTAEAGTLVLRGGNPIRRTGRWRVPRRVVLRRRWQSALLHLTQAELSSREVEFVLDLRVSVVLIVVPRRTEVVTENLRSTKSGVTPSIVFYGGIQRSTAEVTPDLRVHLAGQLDRLSLLKVRWPNALERRRLHRAASRASS